MKTITVGEIAELVAGEVLGDAAAEVSDIAPIQKAQSRHLTFADSKRNLNRLTECDAGCVMLTREAGAARRPNWKPANYILVDDPLSAVLLLLEQLRPPTKRPDVGVSPEAFISGSAVIGENTIVHPGATIGNEAVIGTGCEIHPGVVVGAGCRIGNDVTLHPNVVLYDGVILGNRVCLHASAVIGTDGFGYRMVNGVRTKLPHYGTVRIEDDVEVGANTTIDRAMIGETVIGEGTKIDNLVMIAHNCEIGRHNVIVGQVGLAGSVTTGDFVVMAGHVGVADHVHLGDRSVIGSKAGVHKDVPAGETYIGIPAVPAADAMRVEMSKKKLPEALKSVRVLEQQVARLRDELHNLKSNGAGHDSAAA